MGAGNKAEGERREWSPSHSVVEGAKEPLSHAVDRGAQRKLRQQQKKLKEEEAKLRPLRKEFHLKHGFPLGADEGEEHQVPNPGRSPNQRLITSLRRRSSVMLGIKVYLVVIDIHIVDCHIYRGALPPKSCTLIYTGRGLNEIIPLYTNPILLHPPTLVNITRHFY